MSSDALENESGSNRQQIDRARPVRTGPLTTVRRVLTRYESTLWLLVAAALTGDLVSTYSGVQRGLTEGNPVVRTALADGGFAAFGVLKLAVVGLGLSVWLGMPRYRRAVVPFGLCLPWTAATLVNVASIL